MHELKHLFKLKNHKYCNGTMKMLSWLALVQMWFTLLLVILKTSFTFRKQLKHKKKTSRDTLKFTRKSRQQRKISVLVCC